MCALVLTDSSILKHQFEAPLWEAQWFKQGIVPDIAPKYPGHGTAQDIRFARSAEPRPDARRNRTLHDFDKYVYCGWLKCWQPSITIII